MDTAAPSPALPTHALAAPLAPGDAAQAEKPALAHGSVSLSYARAAADVERVAAKLMELGIGPGDIVAVHLRKPLTHWMVTLGLMRLGAVSVSLTRNAQNELAALPGVSTVVCGAGEEDAFPETLWRFGVTPDWLDRPSPEAGLLPSAQAAGRSVGRICFTSGTSGRPKAILLDAGLLGARLAGTARRTGIDGSSTLWCGLGPDTAYGFTATLATWLAGGAVMLSTGGAGAGAQMRARGVNIAVASPAALGPLTRDAASTGLPPIDGPVIVAGGRLSVELRDQIRANVSATVMVAYGSSEAGGVSVGNADDLDLHPGWVGQIFPDIDVELVDPDDRPLPPGIQGRLRVRTDSTVPGYINDDIASQAVFDRGWFYPGDIAALSDTGALTLFGRITQILNIGGVKIPVDALEERLSTLEDVDAACALLLDDAGSEPELIFVVAAQPEAASALAPRLRTAFPGLPPVRLFSTSQLPRGSMGKIRRQEVAEAVRRALAGTPGAPGAVTLDLRGTI